MSKSLVLGVMSACLIAEISVDIGFAYVDGFLFSVKEELFGIFQ